MAGAPEKTELERVTAELSGEITEICGHLNVLHARLVAITERALITGAWGGHGIRSPEHWVAWQTGLSPARAKQVVLLAKRRHELPVTIAAFDAGELSIDQAAAVAVHVRSANDAEACGIAKQATVLQLTNLLSRYRYGDEDDVERESPAPAANDVEDIDEDAFDDAPVEDAPADEPPVFAHGITAPTDVDRARTAAAPGRVFFGFDDDGRFSLHANLPPHVGARLEAALREAKDRLFRAGRTDVTWADALLDVAERSLASTSASRRHRYRTYLHLDMDGAWLQNGPALPTALLDQLLCDGELQPVWERNGHPVNIGRAARAIPDHTRRLVLDRDRVCRYPGCTAHVGLEVHHLVHWILGGRTDLTNLAAYCANHHSRHHRGEFTVDGNAELPDGLTHRRADGTVIHAHQKPTLPTTAPPAPERPYRHPTGERLDTACVNFTDPGAPPPTRPPTPSRPRASETWTPSWDLPRLPQPPDGDDPPGEPGATAPASASWPTMADVMRMVGIEPDPPRAAPLDAVA